MYSDAFPLYAASYDTRRSVLGDLHHHTLMTMYDFIWANLKMDKNTDAEELFIICLDGRKQICGIEDGKTLQAMKWSRRAISQIKTQIGSRSSI